MLTKQTNYTNLRQNLASILDEIIEDRGIVIVNRTGKEDVAMLSAQELSSMMETLYLLKSPANARKLLAAMERANELEGVKIESQSVSELCEELKIEQ
ncbi:type II toxin-antitoxin system prevent-host-death family antitoxin [Cyanobacterium aponinum UTEX 3222]|uniref:Antitoxin n=2 Tax=Cyanobacterium aponinum TaxID=379064 RepID=A0A844GSI6_9CHRO|nr:type II toxin-antitoxin system prevent-host-death family antitoxin [Cyanobacterium aponinum]WRL41852.1 type II toxin-antitoxin system prevent-host-death family antitoxin [Cyanobacterium aponinum UTEX 3222]MTF38940.1 type II toxin-antitoxin system prevent-host-death family antitoxin [Cyanobacterium aponinum 0216]PHV62770.1 prevent-host-death family protein [Cyanobacterium aponinum IPPAS B-1201]WPF90040.1 type II toxin-antitoxin system prevent-host-death family antitoxin [Cyanobacterium aponin